MSVWDENLKICCLMAVEELKLLIIKKLLLKLRSSTIHFFQDLSQEKGAGESLFVCGSQYFIHSFQICIFMVFIWQCFSQTCYLPRPTTF